MVIEFRSYQLDDEPAWTSVPALIVVGRDDEFTPVAVAEFMARLIPQATLAVIDSAAHMPNLERSAQFNRVLHRFLALSAESTGPCMVSSGLGEALLVGKER